jgi:F-type H+-transporting ATPase subunit epsilon
MADKILFELVSPEKILLSEAVDMVVVPGTEGNFGVLAGHAPLISTVRPGMIEVYDGDTVGERLFVDGGFAEVTGERCTVLADDAIVISSLDRGAIEAEIADLSGRIDGLKAAAESGDDAEKAAFTVTEKRLAVARAKIEVLDLVGRETAH